METIQVRAVVQPDGSIHIGDLPFPPSEEVDVMVQAQRHLPSPSTLSLLEGTVLKYIDPTEPVLGDDWEAVDARIRVYNHVQELE